MYLRIVSFNGTTITHANRRQLSYVDNTAVISRIGVLPNGVKYDADGTTTADTTLGKVTTRWSIVPSGNGMDALIFHTNVFESLRGRRGTLVANSYAPEGTTTLTCTARCVDVTLEEYSVDNNGLPLIAAARTRAWAVVTWEKLTDWST